MCILYILPVMLNGRGYIVQLLQTKLCNRCRVTGDNRTSRLTGVRKGCLERGERPRLMSDGQPSMTQEV